LIGLFLIIFFNAFVIFVLVLKLDYAKTAKPRNLIHAKFFPLKVGSLRGKFR